MAVVRARSSPPYALIVFVFLTVVSAGIAIYVAIGKSDAEKKLADAQDKLKLVQASSDSPLADRLGRARSTKTQSLLGVAGTQIDNLKALIEKSDGKSPEEVVLDAKKTLADAGEGDKTLADAVTDLTTQAITAKNETAGVKQQLKDLQGRADQMATANKGTTDSSNQTVTTLKDQLTAAQTALAAANKDKEDYATGATKDLATEKTGREEDKRHWFLEKQDLMNKIAQLEQNVESLKQQIKTQSAPSVAIAPAGHIVRTQVTSNECYIDLGQKDHVVVGLTFAVFDARTGVRGKIEDQSAKEDVAAAGKGGIEVLEVGANESLCRITMTMKGQMMQPGDLISNPVYQNSKNRKMHFVVFGDFDLDGDGVSTAAERNRVIHLITAWGGVVDDDLTPQTDYLVLGTEPAAASNKNDDQPGSATDKQAEIRKHIEDITVEAKRDSVPILNANRFLAMVGYYNTSIVK